MAKAKELYISLRDDPDLNIPEGDTRESAAWSEMSHRMRQHQSNATALGMATETTSPVEKLALFTANQDFFRSNILESLDVILMKASGSDDATKAYRRASMKMHPDKTQNPDHKEFHSDKFKELTRIYEGEGGTAGGGKMYHMKEAMENQKNKEYQRHINSPKTIFDKTKLEEALKKTRESAKGTKGPLKEMYGFKIRTLSEVLKIHNQPGGFDNVSDSQLSHITDALGFEGGDLHDTDFFRIHDALEKRATSNNPQSRIDKLRGRQTYKFDTAKYTQWGKLLADKLHKNEMDSFANDPDYAAPDEGDIEEQINNHSSQFDADKAAAFPDWSPDEKSESQRDDDRVREQQRSDAAKKAREEADTQRAEQAKRDKEAQDKVAAEAKAKADEAKKQEEQAAKAKAEQETAEKAAKEAAEKEEAATKAKAEGADTPRKKYSDLTSEEKEARDLEARKTASKEAKEAADSGLDEEEVDRVENNAYAREMSDDPKKEAERQRANARGRERKARARAKKEADEKAKAEKESNTANTEEDNLDDEVEADTGSTPPPKDPPDDGGDDGGSQDDSSADESEPESSSEVSDEEHENVKKIIGELAGRHRNRGDSYAKQNLDSFGSEYIDRLNNNKLTREDVDKLKDHLNDFDEDAEHLRDKGLDISNYVDDQPKSEQPKSEQPETEQPEGDDDDLDDGGDDDLDDGDVDPNSVDGLMDRAIKEGIIDHLYDKYNPDNSPFADSKEEFEAKFREKNKDASKLKDQLHKVHGQMTSARKTAERTEAKAKDTAEKTERAEKVKDLQDRAAGSKDLKMSKREAEALIDEHGDADTAFDAHEKAFADKTKKQKSANELPYTTDDLSKKIFGDVDPTSILTHLSEDRKKNKFGDVSTSLARELIAHYKTHAGVMDAKTEKELVEQLAFLKDPSKRFPNMRIPKGETIGADIKAANDMVNEAKEKGYDLNGPEAGRLYEKREAERTRRVQHHQTSHVNPDSKEKKEASHGEGVDPSNVDERTGVFSETDNTSFLHFDEDGNVTGRKRFHPSGGEHHENFKDDGSDDHHIRGDHEVKGSPVKEHITPSHGSNLTNKEKASIDSLREAHKAKATAERSGDAAASAKADEDIAQHTQDLTAGDAGLKESDFLHDEDDIPTVGPPNPQVAAKMRAQGLEWNEGIRHWVAKDGHDERTKAAGSAFSHVGDGASMGIHTAEIGADGQLNQSHASGSFIHTNNGQYHAVDHTADSIPSSHAGVQAQKLGGIESVGKAATKASESGNTQMVSARDHGHLTAHGASSAPKKDIFDRTGGAVKGAGKGVARVAAKARRLIGLKKLIEEESDNLSSVQSLQLHIALQKLEEKQKIAV